MSGCKGLIWPLLNMFELWCVMGYNILTTIHTIVPSQKSITIFVFQLKNKCTHKITWHAAQQKISVETKQLFVYQLVYRHFLAHNISSLLKQFLFFHSLTTKIWLLISPSSCHTLSCKFSLQLIIWCKNVDQNDNFYHWLLINILIICLLDNVWLWKEEVIRLLITSWYIHSPFLLKNQLEKGCLNKPQASNSFYTVMFWKCHCTDWVGSHSSS